MAISSQFSQTSADNFPTRSVLDILREFMPQCAPQKLHQLQLEKIKSVSDLALLDKKDLKELGFNMLERSMILRYARTITDVRPVGSVGQDNFSSKQTGTSRRLSDGFIPEDSFRFRSSSMIGDEEQGKHLDDVEEDARFWLSLASCAESNPRNDHIEDVIDLLESVFDITDERVNEVFADIDANSDGDIGAQELGTGFERLGVHGLQHDAPSKIINRVNLRRGCLRLSEFKAILTRLKLAQLFSGRLVLARENQAERCNYLDVVDYNRFELIEKRIWDSVQTDDSSQHGQLHHFFFGHRKNRDDALVRWIHFPCLSGSDIGSAGLKLLLALTIKYQWSPLAVEDVIEQCPTRLDRYGDHYFVAIEELILSEKMDDAQRSGTKQVRVCGRHTSIFCSGPPEFDTVITITQEDKSFSRDWPEAWNTQHKGRHVWAGKLQERLKQAHRSRLRERRADFLMYIVVDLCSDDLVTVTHAYTARMRHLEEAFHRHQATYASEVSRITLELNIVSRRLRSLHRVVRKWKDFHDISADLIGYIKDVLDNLEEALEDSCLLSDKCTALLASYERADDGTKQMNKILFVLTTFTSMFLPMHFFAGVYGMNFANSKGLFDIPELLIPQGYYIFWVGVIAYVIFICRVFFRNFNYTLRVSKTHNRITLAAASQNG